MRERWKQTDWNGKDFASIGIDLKVLLTTSPGRLGQFIRDYYLCRSPTSRAAERVRDLLPLPVGVYTQEEEEWDLRLQGTSFPGIADKTDEILRKSAGIKAWLWVVVVVLNFLYSGECHLDSSSSNR